MNIFEIRQIAKKEIQEKNLDISVINLLLEEVLGLSTQEILIKNIQNLEQEQESRFFSLLNEYLDNKRPLQYILGYTYFYRRKFVVSPSVLIPRFETEELVEYSLNIIKKHKYKKIVDIGCGSGNIAISLKKEMEELEVLALDISLDVLKISQENASRLKADVNFHQSDLLEYLILNKIKVDLIVSNPPYIAYNDSEVDDIVRNNEPHLALYAADDGLANYKKIINDALLVLNKGGSICFEIGYKQGESLKKYVLDNFLEYEIYVIKDIAKKDRILYLKLKV